MGMVGGGQRGKTGGALTPQIWGVPGLLDECRRGQGQAVGLMGRTETLRRDSWEIVLGFHAGVGLGPDTPKSGFRLGNTWEGWGGGRELRSPAG